MTPKELPSDPVERNRELARRWFVAMSATDLPALRELMAEDVELNTSPSVRLEPRVGREEVLGRLERVFTSGRYYEPGTFHCEPLDIMVEGDRTATRAVFSGTFPNGNAYENTYLIWQQWRDDEMYYMLELFDPTHWSNQRNAEK